MNILIVSGFLGAGKTTFIKELIRRTGTNPVILENEYGDNNIDAMELQSSNPGKSKLEILEFMEGCVCCTKKDSFVNSVLTVYSSLSPEYLIVEPTGVGMLSRIISNLQPILHGDVALLKPVVVLAPRSYGQNMNEWEALYKDQIRNAGVVVFSKCENETPEVLAETASAIRSLNPDALITDSHYTRQGDDWWRSILALPAERPDVKESEEAVDEFSQLTLDNATLHNPAELITLLEDCLRGELGHIVRAKGTLPVGKETLRFDLADNLYAISGSPQETNQCVFIGRDLDTPVICKRMGSLFEKQKVSLTRAYVNRQRKTP